MEKFNRFLSYLTKNDLVKMISVDNNSDYFNLYYISVVLKTSLDVFLDSIDEFIVKNDFTFLTFKDNIVYLISDDMSLIEIRIVLNITNDEAKTNNIYNPLNIEYSKSNYDYLVEAVNNMIINLDKYIAYLKKNELITSYNYLVSADNEIIKFLSKLFLNKDYIVKMDDLFAHMTKEKITEFKNYHNLLNITKMLECSKMMMWFINDYLVTLPISIASLINIDVYINLKKQITNL